MNEYVWLVYFSLCFTCINHLHILDMVVTIPGTYSKVPNLQLGSFDKYKPNVKKNMVIILGEKSHLNGS